MPHRRADCQNVCKHACSFIHVKHFKEELCDAARPGMELQRARAFGWTRRGVTAPAHIKADKSENCTSSAASVLEQVRDDAHSAK